MGCYILAVGGTGNKILESAVYCAAVDGFSAPGEADRPQPLPLVRMLSVDVDAACGNTTRAKRAAEYYEQVREAFAQYPARHRGFHTRLIARRWDMNLSRRAKSVDSMVENHRRDKLLSHTLFSKTESALDYGEGFRGHPDLGVLFFSQLLDSLERLREQGQPDEMNDLTDQMRRDLDAGETVKVILCGSIFGGTGAAGIPSIARYLRRLFAGDEERFVLASMLMLPYYKVPPASKNEELEIVVKSSAFLDKARTALQYYGMEGLIRDGEGDGSGAFDAVYLLGLPPESFVTTRIYSTGSQSQENDAHMLEWLAARCVAQFFRTGFRGAEAHNIDCYYYQWHTPAFCWQSFDCEAEAYRAGYGGLLKAAALFFGECYPTLLEYCARGQGRNARVGYCAPYFSRLGRADSGTRARLESLLDSLYHFLAFYANWTIQVVRTLPPTMRPRREDERLWALAKKNYDRLTDRGALLKERAEDEAAPTADSAGLQADYEQLRETQRQLLPQIGGSAWLEILKAAQEEARESLYRQEEQTAAQAERVERWHGEDADLIEPRLLRQEEERLGAMGRALRGMEARLRLIGNDIESAIWENGTASCHAPAGEQADALPRNQLLNADLLTALSALLTQYGLPAAARDGAAYQRARMALQKGLHQLVLHRVPDRADTARAIAGLGGGVCQGWGAEGMLCSFFATLLDAVGEEERS